MNQSFQQWLKAHPCTKNELWKLQNCLGSTLGFDHPLAKEVGKAWQEDERKCAVVISEHTFILSKPWFYLFSRYLFGKCKHCDLTIKATRETWIKWHVNTEYRNTFL